MCEDQIVNDFEGSNLIKARIKAPISSIQICLAQGKPRCLKFWSATNFRVSIWDGGSSKHCFFWYFFRRLSCSFMFVKQNLGLLNHPEYLYSPFRIRSVFFFFRKINEWLKVANYFKVVYLWQDRFVARYTWTVFR